MLKEETLHIIDYILDKTNPKKNNPQMSRVRHEHRKKKHDDLIKICINCGHMWSKVPDWVDKSLLKIYPIGIIPKIGKKYKKCPLCSALEIRRIK
tara:strand:+ start:179 stop:463 length:285 start_codon:yes stop_codon:yes gene_type:complete